MILEPVGSTHLRFGDARVVEILVCGNPIEQGIGIPTIESRASNILMTKGIVYGID